MNMAKDHKARFGYEPDWKLHQEKQKQIAEARDAKVERKLRENGLV